MEEMIEKFSLESVGKAAGVFNSEKLLDLNAWYIRESSDEFLAERLIPFLENQGFKNLDMERVTKAVSLLKVRSKTLVEMAEGAEFCLAEEIRYEKKGDDKFLKPDVLELFEDLNNRLAAMPEFNQESIEKLFIDFLEQKEIKLRKLAQPLRVALTGKTASPGIFEVMEVLDREKVLERISKAVAHMKNKE